MSTRDFWSRRKAAVEAEDAALKQEVETTELEAAAAEKTDMEILEDLGLPDPETLGEGDDFSGFMAKAVPNRLRNRALRRLWGTNPVLANIDGLVDYGEDFTDSAMVVENMQTAYQIGKGMTKHVEAMLRQAEEEASTENDPDTREEDAPASEDAADAAADQVVASEPAHAPAAPEPAQSTRTETETAASYQSRPEITEEKHRKPRRMRYSFPNAPGEDA